VLVTGSEGFIGQNLARLIRDEHDVTKFDLAESLMHDVKSLHNLPDKPVDVIVHLASLCVDPESVEHPLSYFKNNLLGTANVLEYARRQGVKKIVFASSASAQEHVTPYGLSKHNGEEWCRLYHELYGLETCILRIFNVYGPKQNKGVIHDFIKQLGHGDKLSILGDGTQVRDYICVFDVVQTIEQLLPFSIGGGCFEVGTGVQTSVNEIVKIFETTLNREIRVQHLPRRPGDVNCSFARNPCVTDFIPLEKGIRMMVLSAGLKTF